MASFIYYVLPLFLVLLALELVATRARRAPDGRAIRGYEARDAVASVTMGLGNVVISLGTKIVVLAAYTALYQFRVFELTNVWWVWALAFLGDDFCYYGFHRASHEVRFLWAAHENHHSSRYYNLSTALRQSWTTPFTGPIFWAPPPNPNPTNRLHLPGLGCSGWPWPGARRCSSSPSPTRSRWTWRSFPSSGSFPSASIS